MTSGADPLAIPQSPLAPAGGRKAKGHRFGPIRDNLEAFGTAILAAVLLKWFCIEAFQIPTSSMQPTLMGSVEAGVYDRILVNKFQPVLTEPKRWDVTVFRYPLQQNQSYVKRLVAMGGEKFTIAGGNLYLVETDAQGKPAKWTVLRKPPRIQERLWKQVFPARQLVRHEAHALDGALSGRPRGVWAESGDGLTATLDGMTARLAVDEGPDGGFVDRVWDGYPTGVASDIRERNGLVRPQEIVPDARLQATITPDAVPESLAFEIEVLRPGKEKLTYALVVKDGKGRLQVRLADSKVAAESAPFDCPLAAGTATRLGFAHVDDLLQAQCDGKEVATLEVGEWHCRDGCVLPFDVKDSKRSGSDQPEQRVVPQIAVKGKAGAKVRISGFTIDRDLHYVQDDMKATIDEKGYIEVPAGHFFMMGDNTLQSVDSRGWTALTVGVMPDGSLVPPGTPGSTDVRGNRRPVPPSQPVDRDETPIAYPARKEMVIIDEFGQIGRYKAGIGPDYSPTHVTLQTIGSVDGRGDFEPPRSKVPFVRREDIQGRPLVAWWPIWPWRLGFIR